MVASDQEQRIDLKRPLLIILTPRTAWFDEDGLEQFRADTYARDGSLARALKRAGVGSD